jgi:phosphoesterase RecJ-like protein
MDREFLDLVNKSERILITSHFSPDADAICSVLLLATTLKENFSKKHIKAALEEKPSTNLTFLADYKSIEFNNLYQAIKKHKPDLLVILDANSLKRCSRSDVKEIESHIRDRQIKVAIIDHHESIGSDDADLFMNNQSPAVTQDVYEICFFSLDLRKPRGYAQTAALGIISDTFRFKYYNPKHRQTFKIVSELIEAGVNIEELENKLERYTHGQMVVISQLASNIRTHEGYNYSFISDKFCEEWQINEKSIDEYKSGCEFFVNQFIRNFDRNYWGFIVYKELGLRGNVYSVSFRSISGTAGKDVSKLAYELGGGGHKPAAGAKIEAQNLEEALKKVQSTIEQNSH